MNKKQIAAIIIRNSEGKFFIHQRLGSKKTFPNRYGVGAGGHVEEGENAIDAAKRELIEETELSSPVEYLFTIDVEEPDVSQIVHVFVTKCDEPIKTDEREWQWSGWMTKVEVDELLSESKLCTDTAIFYKRYISESTS